MIFESLNLINVMNFQELINGFQKRKNKLCYSYRHKDNIINESFGNLYSKIACYRTQLSDLTENSAILIASSKIDGLIPLFLSSLSLNLRPAFVAYPSHKVSRADYQSKLSHILDNFHVSRIVIDKSENDTAAQAS